MLTAPNTPYTRDEHAWVDGAAARVRLPIEGALPPELRGVFAKNSGNPKHQPRGRYHWFDGDGLIHAIHFADGEAWLQSEWVQTDAMALEDEAGRALWGGLLDPIAPPPGQAPFKDTANTDLTFWRGELLASWWLSGTPRRIDPQSLQTLGPQTFGRERPVSVTAHPKVDPRTGELIFFGYSVLRAPWVHVGTANADGSLARYDAVDLPHPHVPHDITLTEHFTILMDFPLGWDEAALAQGRRRIRFYPERPARFGLLPRHGAMAELRWFEATSCYMYHTVAAWEQGEEVVIIGSRIADPIPTQPTTDRVVARLDNIELVPYLWKWTLNTRTGAVTEEQLSELVGEFPRGDDRRLGTRQRFAWVPRIAAREALSFDGLVRVNLETGEHRLHEYAPGWTSGEAVLAPRPGGTDEEDGWVITVKTLPAEDRSELIVLDAARPEAGPIARARLPRRISQGFHAEWAPLGA